MGLPNSRDATLTPGDKFPSAIINKLQDVVIAHQAWQDGAKFSSTSIVISGAEFLILNGAPVRNVCTWSFGAGGGDDLFVPFSLPVNTRLVDVVWSGLWSSLTVALVRYPLGGSVYSEALSIFSKSGAGWEQLSESSPGVTVYTGGNLPHIIEAGYSYLLEVGGSGATITKFDGVTLTFDRL